MIYWTVAIDISNIPDLTNRACLSNDQLYNISEYNKLEIVNNLEKYSLADLLSHRGLVLENNVQYQQFLYCAWKNENYILANDDINREVLEKIIKNAIINVVGTTGPAIHLSTAHARNIVNDCGIITANNAGQKIIKIQNYIVKKLIPFSKI